MDSVQGECDPRFARVKELLAQYLDSNEELGASICINLDGRTVVDIWGGHADLERTEPWTKNTVGPVWSTTKCVTNLAALILIDRGLLDPGEKVAKYWPEFAANGKQDVEVRHILSHTSGLAAWDTPITVEDIYDVPSATAKLARQAPWWTPGTSSGYHLISQGHLVGELVQRVSGKSLRDFVKTEIAVPLGADFQIGADEEDWDRICDIVPPPPPSVMPDGIDPESVMMKAFNGTPMKAENASTAEFRRARLGGMGGFGNARSVVQILSAITLGGSAAGKQLLSQKTVDLIFVEQSNGMDLVLATPLTFGVGFALATKAQTNGWVPQGRTCFWVGWGGSAGIMDMDKRMTIGYTMNKMGEGMVGSSRTEAYVRAIYSAMSDVEANV